MLTVLKMDSHLLLSTETSILLNIMMLWYKFLQHVYCIYERLLKATACTQLILKLNITI